MVNVLNRRQHLNSIQETENVELEKQRKRWRQLSATKTSRKLVVASDAYISLRH